MTEIHGCTIEKQRTAWSRWDEDALRTRMSHPTMYLVTEPDGYQRYFDRHRDAAAWIAENYGSSTDA